MQEAEKVVDHMTDNRILHFFPQEYIDLQQELQHHPELCTLLANHPAEDFEIKLAEIAAYLLIVLDGDYLPEDLQKLAGIMTYRLKEKRGAVDFIVIADMSDIPPPSTLLH